LCQVVANLVGNAVKHGEPGQPVYVVTRDEGDQVALLVCNVGPPIPTELIPTVFEPFHHGQMRRVSGQGSFGLGLYIVRRLMQLVGGRVSAHSAGVGQGAQFVLAWPVAPAEPM